MTPQQRGPVRIIIKRTKERDMLRAHLAGKSAVTLVTAGVALGALTGCGSSGSTTSSPSTATAAQKTSGKTTGFTLAGNEGLTSDPFWISAACGGTRAAEAAGSTITWKGFTTNTTSADSANVQAIQLLHPDGVVMASPTSLQFESERQQWMSTGTPVEEINTVTNDPNFYKAYTAAPTAVWVLQFAKLIAKEVGNSGSFAILGGQAGLPFLEAGWKPVVSTLHRVDPGLNVLPTQYDNFDTNTAATIVSGLLVAHPDLKGIYSLTGPEGSGVISALQQANKSGKVEVFSGSGDPDLVADLKAGAINALLSQSPYLMGYDAVQNLIQYLKTHKAGKGPIPHATPQAESLPNYIITRNNVNTPQAKEYEYLTTCS